MDAQTLYSLGTVLAFAGMLIIVVATALILLSKNRNRKGQRRRSDNNRANPDSLRHRQTITQNSPAALNNPHGTSDSTDCNAALPVQINEEKAMVQMRETSEPLGEEPNTRESS